jgi:hypothetical protein
MNALSLASQRPLLMSEAEVLAYLGLRPNDLKSLRMQGKIKGHTQYHT